jgi:hypothetical protein
MTSTVKRRPAAIAAAVLSVAALFGAIAVTQADAALRHFEGTVLSKNSDNRTFRIEKENGNRARFHVNGATEFQRIPGGFSGLHRGLRVEVSAKRTDNGLLAKRVEKRRASSGGGGGDDGRHHGGGDDGPHHGGGGADDGPNHT